MALLDQGEHLRGALPEVLIGAEGAVDRMAVRQVLAPEGLARVLLGEPLGGRGWDQLGRRARRESRKIQGEGGLRVRLERERRMGAVRDNPQPVQQEAARQIGHRPVVLQLRQFLLRGEHKSPAPDLRDGHAADSDDPRPEHPFVARAISSPAGRACRR